MSSSVTSRKPMKSATECSLCLSHCRAPRLLPCCHTFCLECLEQYCADGQNSSSRACPVCDQAFILPEGEVKWLPTDEFIDRMARKMDTTSETEKCCHLCIEVQKNTEASVYCRECRKYFCTICQLMHDNLMRESRSHKLRPIDEGVGLPDESEKHTMCYCKKHANKELELYCSDCDALLCFMCQLTEHQNHKCKVMGDVVKQTRIQLEETRNHMENFAAEWKQKIQTQSLDENSIANQVTEVGHQIKIRCGHIKKGINKSKTRLLEELDSIKEDDSKEMTLRNDETRRIIEITDGFVEYINLLLDYGRDYEVAGMSGHLLKRANVLTEFSTKHSSKGETEKRVRFIEPPVVGRSIENFLRMIGRIEYTEVRPETKALLDQSGCKNLLHSLIGRNARAISLKSSKGQLHLAGGLVVIGLMIGVIASFLLLGDRKIDQAYVYDFTSSSCTVRTIDQLLQGGVGISGVAVLGDDIFVIRNRLPEVTVYDLNNLTWKRAITIPSMKNPYSIVACSHSQSLYVNDVSEKYIFKVDCSGNNVKSWKIAHEAQMRGMSMTPRNTLLVTLYQTDGRGIILEFDSYGAMISERHLDKDNVSFPRHVVQIPNGIVIVSHGDNKYVPHPACLLDSNWAVTLCHGELVGSEDRKDIGPYLISYDSKRSVVYVADAVNKRVVILGLNLTCIGKVALLPEDTSIFNVHYHLPSDQLFVGYGNGRVVVVNPPKFLHSD